MSSFRERKSSLLLLLLLRSFFLDLNLGLAIFAFRTAILFKEFKSRLILGCLFKFLDGVLPLFLKGFQLCLEILNPEGVVACNDHARSVDAIQRLVSSGVIFIKPAGTNSPPIYKCADILRVL